MIYAWLILGAAALPLLELSYRINLGRRDGITLGTVVTWLGCFALPPVFLLFSVVGMALWLFDPAIDARRVGVGAWWPDWWGRIQYRRHQAWRWLWYLGRPPSEESYLSDWRNAPKAWRD